jgi:hypothetical protein
VDSQLVTRLVGRGNENLYPDLASGWRQTFASDERTIECNIAGEAALRVLTTVVPVEDHRKAQLVAYRGAAS